jgi:hypothetical protein
MVLRLIRDLPGAEFLWPPSPRELRDTSDPGRAERASARLSINNGCQDHTISPSATLPLVLHAFSTAHELLRPATSCAHDTVASTAPRLTFRDDTRVTPLLLRRDGKSTAINFWKTEAQYFSRGGWTGIYELCPSGKSLGVEFVKRLRRSPLFSRAQRSCAWWEGQGGSAVRAIRSTNQLASASSRASEFCSHGITAPSTPRSARARAAGSCP